MVGFIEGKRIDLVPLNAEHAELYMLWLNDERIRRNLGRVYPQNTEQIKKGMEATNEKQNKVEFEILIKDTQVPIGWVTLKHINWPNRFATIMVLIGEFNYWKQGYATEATQLIIEYAFGELNLHKIAADIFASDTAARRTAEKVGMRVEGVFKDDIYVNGRYVDDIDYAIFETDWKEMKKKGKQTR